MAAWAPPSSLFVRPVPVSHRDTRRSSLSSSSRPASSPTRRPRARSSVQRETMPHSSSWFNSGRSAERCSLFNTIHNPDVFARISFCVDIDKKAWLHTTSCLYTWRPRLAKSVGILAGSPRNVLAVFAGNLKIATRRHALLSLRALGILKQMKETFETNLSQSQKDELQAAWQAV